MSDSWSQVSRCPPNRVNSKVSIFTSSDPAAGTADPRTPIDRMRWIYAANNPIDMVDPSGRIWVPDSTPTCDTNCQALYVAPSPPSKYPTQPHGTKPNGTTSTPACRSRVGCYDPAANEACLIGSQACDAFAQHFGKQLLNIACGFTICPAIQGTESGYELVTDPAGWWHQENDDWNATKDYWSSQWDTYSGYQKGPARYIPEGPLALYLMKWSGDRITDFEKDPGTGSANILVFFVSFAIPGPKVLGVERDASGTAVRTASSGTDFVVHPSGAAVAIPDGATGPINAANGKGVIYVGGRGGKGLNSRVTGVRIMDPTPQYPNGYGTYMNSFGTGQTVDPYTGRTIPNNDPRAHIPF